MKHLLKVFLVSLLFCGNHFKANAQVSSINSAFMFPRVFNDVPSATLTINNSYPESIQFTEANVSGSGFANRDVWYFSNNGGVSPYLFQNNDYFNASFSITLTGSGTTGIDLEAGWIFSNPSGSFGGDLQSIVQSDGAVVQFGGPSFFGFSPPFGTSVPNYVLGATYTMGLNYVLDPNTGNNAFQYSVNGVFATSSPGNTYFDLGPGQFIGSSGSTLGGYFQIQNDPSNPSNSGSAVFQNISISVPSVVPLIIFQPQSRSVQAESNATFTVTAIGTWPLKYQWQFSGSPLTGATNASLPLNNVQFTNAGGYSVVITNTYGSVTSTVAWLTVFTNLAVAQTNEPPPPPGSPTIPTDATQFKVFTNGGFVSGIGLDPSKSTIVLTHGLNESSESSTDWPQEMANIIKFELGSSTPNIVAWDWTAVAAEKLPAATLATQGQGYALGENLTNALGANYSQRIHFIGHSLGTLVNARAANFIHTNGFSWANTQMTLLDEAEVAWGTVEDTWQTATSLLQNDSAPQQDWKHPLPDQCAWADNYITAVGMPHPQAVNVILTNTTPDYSNIQNLLDLIIVAGAEKLKFTDQFLTEDTDYHNYPYVWYENTVSQINNPNDPPYLMGFIRSWEGGGYAIRPSANTYYIESQNCPPSFPSYSGYDPAYNLVQITPDQANQYLNARPQNLISQVGVNLINSSANILANNNNQQVQLLNGPAVNVSSLIAGPYNGFETAFATEVKLVTTSLINGLVRPLGGPVPQGGSGGNSPAYVWIPVTLPPNALTIAFNFMLQGNGNQDSFQVAMNSNNLMTVETVLIQTNVTMNSGMIDVSQYAGQQVQLFFGIVGGTSTNASVTVSDIAFYVTLPPLLRIQMAGTNVVLTWPLSATGYVLQSANQLTPPMPWTTVTNVPVIVNFQYTVTNQISSGSRFYRLAIIAPPTLLARVSGSNFILSWPMSAQNFNLQTTTNLADPNSWTTLTNVPAIVNLQNTITNPITGNQGFYRLIQSQ